ncbi:hypothetical protein [Belliella aquatica]|uniref:Uncharacterized protein n=1 Tax=Belliella aquatica TaxID=1323734 RepID=A0ABQ1LXA6_9BACT|nr:hypothetical protein [Belliella aquatica]MCH7407301.1 hypothetical protein [Belliella aquatica]GGC31550.1 hypothetical protein GCM10010993_08160 [Belliella aquatica]
MLDIIVIIAVIIALANTNSSMAKRFGLSVKLTMHLNYLLFYHLFFSVFFTWYIMNFGGDSQGYWKFGMEQVIIKGDKTWFSYFGEGTTFILWLCYIPSQIMGLSYVTGNILFGALGFIGIRYLYIMVATLFPMNHKVLNIPLFPTVFYFLNLHFWSAGVGKDTIAFWGIAWFFFALQKYQSRWWQAAVALFFVYLTRPHMGQALISGAGIAILLGSEVKMGYKIVLTSFAFGMAVYLLPSTLEALKIDELSIESLETMSGLRSSGLNSSNVGSGFNLQSYPWPFKLFTYMFRPLFFDAHNIVAFFSSFENALYLWLSFFIYRNWTAEAIRDMPLFIKAGMITFIPVTIAFMGALSNLGIIMRMKNMTMIYFLLFCFFLIAYNKKLRYQRAQEKIRYYQQREEIIAKKAAASERVE